MAATATLLRPGAEERPQGGGVVHVLSSGDEEDNSMREKNKKDTPESSRANVWTKAVQSEPLNLTLGGGGKMMNGDKSGRDRQQDDDDVMFVTAYIEDEENNRPSTDSSKPLVQRKRGPQRGGAGKGTPRRNPARRARRAKHFPDFEEVNFDEDDVVIDGDDDDDDDDFTTYISNNFSKREDSSEEWTVAERRAKQKKKLLAKKPPAVGNGQQQHQQQQQQKTNKPGRKRRNATCIEKKVPLRDLEPVVRSNLDLLNGYTDLIGSLSPSGFSDNFRNHLVEITKRQNVLLNLTREVIL